MVVTNENDLCYIYIDIYSFKSRIASITLYVHNFNKNSLQQNLLRLSELGSCEHAHTFYVHICLYSSI